MNVRGLALVCFVSVSLLAGCGGGGSKDKWEKQRPSVYPVTGVVTLNGEKLEGAVVTFRPKNGTDAATGKTDSDGRFRLTTFDSNDGATAGEFTVTVSLYEEVIPPEGYNADTSPPLPAPKLLTPPKYADFSKSGLVFSVSDNGKNDFVIQLQK
ncbi:carboxypeptidase-like regulatory domain-containing protein [Planctomicrobium sp. SH527]|uniref:carboxypeptidase-like regulatory domain-containing protein n=1 Tax=Planctomicrobium sp. SH527 TaxID=3448123 RepID=UPI003F5C625F